MISLGPFDTVEQMINGAIDLVRRHGFYVTEDRSEFETVADFRSRMDIRAPSYLAKLLAHPDCPHFISVRGTSGRILKLKSNPQLEAWIAAHHDQQRRP